MSSDVVAAQARTTVVRVMIRYCRLASTSYVTCGCSRVPRDHRGC